MIGGNVSAIVQIENAPVENAIGERVSGWIPVQTLTGFIDYSGGDAKRANFDSKIQESTHLFICDFVALDSRINETNTRIVINGKNYEPMKFDNPMELNHHWEIFMKYVGG